MIKKFTEQINITSQECERRLAAALGVHARYISDVQPGAVGDKHVQLTWGEPALSDEDFLKILRPGVQQPQMESKSIAIEKGTVMAETKIEAPQMVSKENEAKIAGVFDDVFLGPLKKWFLAQLTELLTKLGIVDAKLTAQAKEIENLKASASKVEIVRAETVQAVEVAKKEALAEIESKQAALEQRISVVEAKLAKAGNVLKG